MKTDVVIQTLCLPRLPYRLSRYRESTKLRTITRMSGVEAMVVVVVVVVLEAAHGMASKLFVQYGLLLTGICWQVDNLLSGKRRNRWSSASGEDRHIILATTTTKIVNIISNICRQCKNNTKIPTAPALAHCPLPPPPSLRVVT